MVGSPPEDSPRDPKHAQEQQRGKKLCDDSNSKIYGYGTLRRVDPYGCLIYFVASTFDFTFPPSMLSSRVRDVPTVLEKLSWQRLLLILITAPTPPLVSSFLLVSARHFSCPPCEPSPMMLSDDCLVVLSESLCDLAREMQLQPLCEFLRLRQAGVDTRLWVCSWVNGSAALVAVPSPNRTMQSAELWHICSSWIAQPRPQQRKKRD